jgi:hypothetical protein
VQIGVEFREAHLVISGTNNNVFEEGQTYNLYLGFANVKRTGAVADPKAATYAVLLSDTVVITSDGAAEPLTHAPRQYKEVSYQISDDKAPEKKAPSDKGEKQDKKEKRRPGDGPSALPASTPDPAAGAAAPTHFFRVIRILQTSTSRWLRPTTAAAAAVCGDPVVRLCSS